MKNVILILFILLAFGACKDDSQPEPDAGVVYENWKILPDSTIRYGFRDIVSTEYRNGILHVNAKNSYYSLDSNLKLSQYRNWIDINTNSTFNQNISPKYSDDYGILINEHNGLTVFDLEQIGSEQISFRFSKDEVEEGTVYWKYSSIDEDKGFSIITSSIVNDSAYYYLHNYTIDHEPGAFKRIKLIKENRVMLLSYKFEAYPVAPINVYRLSGKIIAHLDGTIYTFNGDKLEDTSRFYITKAFEADGNLYAASMSVIYFSDNHQTSDGLLVSKNQGITWEYYGYGSTYRVSNFKVLNGLKFMYKSSFIALLDDETKEVREMNLNGLDAAIHSIEKVGNKVVVGTDAGVYYKSWESFLNK